MSIFEPKGLPFRFSNTVDVHDCKTSEEAIVKAKLNWNVAKYPLYTKHNNEDVLITNYHTTYRTDTNTPLGIIKDRYEVVQNARAFQLFDDLVKNKGGVWDTAGCLDGGRKVFITVKLPTIIMVDNNDPVDLYFLFVTSHDGSIGLKVVLTPIRVFCLNTMNTAIKQSNSYVSLVHSPNIHTKIDLTEQLMAINSESIKYTSDIYNLMAKTKVSDIEAYEYFKKIVLTKDEILKIENTGHTVAEIIYKSRQAIEDSQIPMRTVNILSNMTNYYFTGFAQTYIIGTKWGVYNAVTGYYSNMDNSIGEARFKSIIFGDKAKKIQTIENMLIA